MAQNKVRLDYLCSHSLGGLIDLTNIHNEENPNAPILKEDIVEIRKEEEAYFLIYYK